MHNLTRTLALSVFSSASIYGVTALNPPDLNLPNYNRLPIGHWGALEGGAYRARAKGSEAIWYNPAGIARTEGNTITANALFIEFTNVEIEGLGTSTEADGFGQLPTFFGTTFDASDSENSNFSYGFAVTTPNSYTQNVKLDQDEYNPSTTLTTHSVLDSSIDFSVLQPHLAFAYRSAEDWTVGGSLWLSLTSRKSSESLGIQARDPTNALRFSQVSFATGDHESLDMGLSFGGQWIISERWAVGATLKTPAIQLSHSSSFSVHLFQDLPTETNEIRFKDTSIDYEIKYPLTLGLGAAYTHEKWNVEIDVIFYENIGSHTVYESNEQIDLLNYNKISTVATQVFDDLPAVKADLDYVINVAIGGHYHVNDRIAVHGGLYTDFSPVASRNDEVYSKLDMFGVMLGVSKKGEINTTSIGLNYNWGSHDISVEDSFSAATGDGKIRIDNFGVLFATSFTY